MSREVRLSDRIKELSYDPGTTRFALTGPVDGFSPFSDFYQKGDVVYYAATDGTRYEVGSGEYTTDGSTKVLTRYPLRSSSLSSGPFYVNDESTSGPTKGTTGYFHPLYLMESSASGLRGYPTEFGSNPPTAVHEHHFLKYPGVTFYMPAEYAGHAETVGGGAPAALSGVDYAASGAAVNFQGVTEVYVTYPGKYSVFSAHGVSGYQEPKYGGVAVWGSEQILDYDKNIVWDFDSEALGISQPNPNFPVDVGGASSYSQVRASGFIDGGSGIAFSGGLALPQDSLKTASGGRQLEPFFRNELDNQTKSDQVFSLSGLVDQRLLLKMQEKGTIFAGPPSGCETVGCDPDYPHFRYLELEDIPDLSDLYVVQKNLIDAGLIPEGAVPHWDASGVIVYDPQFVYKSSTDRLGIGTDSPQTALDVNGDITASGNIYASGLAEVAGDLMVRGSVTVSGGLDIQGSLTYIDSTTVTLLDKQIELASMSGSPPDNYDDAFIDDGGIVLKGTQGDKKWTWRDATDSWTTDQGIDASGITFNDLSVISGAYHPGSGLELHNQIELHVGNLFQVSGEDGTNCFIHQGGALIASGISGIDTSVTRIGNSGRLLIDPTHLRQEVLDKHTSSINLVGDSGNKVFDAASGLIHNSGNFLLSSGVQVSGWAGHYTNARVADSGNFLLSSGVQVSGWAGHYTNARVADSGNFLLSSGVQVSGWTNHNFTKTNSTITELSGILSGVDLTLHRDINHSGNMLKDLIGGGGGGMTNWTVAVKNEAAVTASETIGDSQTLNVEGRSGIVTEYKTSDNRIFVGQTFASGNFLLSSGIQVSGWANHYTDARVGDSGNKVNDFLISSGNFLLSSGVQVSGWSRHYTDAKVGDSGNKVFDSVVNSGQAIINKFISSGNFLLSSGVQVSGWVNTHVTHRVSDSGNPIKDELGDSGNFLNDRIDALTAADNNYGHWVARTTNSFGTSLKNIESTDSVEFKGGGTPATSGINIQFDTSSNQVQFGVDFTSGNTIVDRFNESGNINNYKVDLSGQLLATQIGSVINYGHWHVKTTNQAGVTADEEVTTNQDVIFKGQSGIATEYVPGTNTLTISLSSGVESPLHHLSGIVYDSGNKAIDRLDASGNANEFLIRVSGQRAVQVSSGLFTEVSGSLAAADTYLTQRIDASGQKFFSAVSGQHLKNELGTSGNHLSDFLSASGQNIENKFNFAYGNVRGSGRLAIESGVVISGLWAESSGNIFAHMDRQSGVFRREIDNNSGIVVQLSGQAITAATSGLHIVNGVNSAKTVKLDPAGSGEIRALMFRRRGAYEDIRIGREAGIAQRFGASNDIAGSFFDSYGISNPEDGGASISIGSKAGYNTVRSSRTIFIGSDAGSEGSGISDLVAIGTNAARGVEAADSLDLLSSFGPDFIDSSIKGVVIGSGAAQNAQLRYASQFGTTIIAIGEDSQKDTFHTTASISIGRNSLKDSDKSSYPVAIGDQAGFNMSDTYGVTAIGTDTGYGVSGNNYSTLVGYQAGRSMMKVPENTQKVEAVTAVGYRAGYFASGLHSSTMIGPYAGAQSPLADSSTRSARGWPDLTEAEASVEYHNNISIGTYAGYRTKGNFNISIGVEAGLGRGNASAGSSAIQSTIIMPTGGNGWRSTNTSSAWYNKDLASNALDNILLLGYDSDTENAPLGGYKSSIYVGDPQDKTDFDDYTLTIDRHNNFKGGLKLRGSSTTSLPFAMAETSLSVYPENELVNNHGFLRIPGWNQTTSAHRFYFRSDRNRNFDGSYSSNANNPFRIWDSAGNDIPKENGMIVIARNLQGGNEYYVFICINGRWMRNAAAWTERW